MQATTRVSTSAERAESHRERRRLTLRVQHWAARVLIHLAVLAGAVVFLFPLFWLVSSSLKPEGDIFLFPPNLWPSEFMWSNYPAALSSFPFIQTGMNTMMIVIGVEVGRLISATLAAYAFARVRMPLRGPLFMLVLSTMMLPYHITLIPQYIIFRDLGWLNSFKPLIVPSFFGGGAFFIFLLRQFFMSIPREYDDAARIDGCGTFGIYWRIILPLSKPALATVAIFTFMGEWNDFFAPLIYLNTPDKWTLALAIKSWELTQQSGLGYKPQPYNHIMAVATLITLVPMLMFFFTQRYFVQGVVVSGIKG
jgi:ABC-type glycerol-3-phosphate transport system permease component